MSNLSMGISPGLRDTRVIAMAGSHETILKGPLSRQPSHPRVLATLLEAVALWQGVHVHAALCATERDGVSDSSLYREAFADFGGPLYTSSGSPRPPSVAAGATSAASVTSPTCAG